MADANTQAAASSNPDATAAGQGGGARKQSLSNVVEADASKTREPSPVLALDAAQAGRQSRDTPAPKPEQQSKPEQAKQETQKADAPRTSEQPQLPPEQSTREDVSKERAQLLQLVKQNPVLTVAEEVVFRDAQARGDRAGEENVRRQAAERVEQQVRGVERATPAEIRELVKLVNAPATRETEQRFNEILKESARRETPAQEAKEVGRVIGLERDRAATETAKVDVRRETASIETQPGKDGTRRPPELNERDPLRDWQVRAVELRDRIAETYQREGNAYTYRGQTAFVDAGKEIKAFDTSPRAAQAIVDLAESKRWSELRVEGNLDFQRAVWMEAKARGMEVRAAEFRPAKQDLELAELRAAEYKQTYGREQAPAPGRVVNEAAERNAAGRDQRQGSDSAPPQRESLADRGLKFVEAGPAPYQFDKANDQSFYVKLERDDGKQSIVWGKDLQRALDVADARPGDRIKLDRPGADPVTLKDEQGNARGAQRAQWTIEVVERGPREVAQTPAQATVEKLLREQGAPQSVIDRSLRVAADKEVTLAREGRAVEVRGVDPQAPRSSPIPTVQIQEQAAPTRVR